MRGSIRKTDFTWDPEHQNRNTVWKDIKAHVEAELDRIAAASKAHARRRRVVESPNYHRDRAIRHDHEVHGSDISTLARRYGLSIARVREIIRVARYRERTFRPGSRLPQAPDTARPQRGLPALPGGPPQTGDVVRDP